MPRLRQKNSQLRRKTDQGDESSKAPPIVHEVLRSAGRPLDAATRSFFEPRFQTDFSHVRVHADGRAAESTQAVNAVAYTVGHNLVFGQGRYAPHDQAGRRLLAHELTHVVQQRQAASAVSRDLAIGSASSSLEREADQRADEIMAGPTSSGPSLSATSGPPLQVQRSADPPKPDAGTKCAKSDLGSISVVSGSLIGDASAAGMSVEFKLTPGSDKCKCSEYRWLQVADIIPGKWQGRDDSYVDPFPNDDVKPYFWTDAEEKGSPNKFTDPPKLKRSRSTDEGKRILNKFETANVCIQAGQKDKVVGVVNWSYEFDTDQTKDIKNGPAKADTPSAFWKGTVAKDFPDYSFED